MFASKEGKRRLSECEIVLIFQAKHENEVEAKRKTAYQAKMSMFVYLKVLKVLV